MAKKTTVVLIDDIDGDEIEDSSGETVFFALDGVSYEIDLSDKNAKKLRKALTPYVENGRRVNRTGRVGATVNAAKQNTAKELAAAREWLRAAGHTVSDRGRIPAKLLEEYRSKA